MLLIGIFFLIVMICTYSGVPIICKIIDQRRFLRDLRKKEGVYLTFDDGPSLDGTPLILNILEKFGIKATFFVLGQQVQKYPEVIDRIVSSGHQLAFHGRFHDHPWETSPLKLWKNVYKTDFPVNSFFRPTFGKYDIFTLIHLKMNRVYSVFWNVDPKDYTVDLTPEAIAARLLEEVKPGSVVLLHDNRINENLSNVAVTAKALEIFLNHAITEFKFRRIDEDFIR